MSETIKGFLSKRKFMGMGSFKTPNLKTYRRRTRIQNLPEELIQDILSRLPLNSVFESKNVCKLWFFLIKQSRFAKMHYNYYLKHTLSSQNQNPTNIILHPCSLTSSSLHYIPNIDRCDRVIKLSKPFTPSSPIQDFLVVDSVNGLLCLLDSKNNNFVICNPVNGDRFELPVTPTLLRRMEILVGFGYSPNTNEYKVVLAENEHYGDLNVTCIVNVITVGGNSWRSIQTSARNINRINGNTSGCFFNGYLHWLTFGGLHIVSHMLLFDVEKENFARVPIPNMIKAAYHDVDLGVLGSNLILVGYTKIDLRVWVLKDYNVKRSWSLEFVIAFPEPSMRTFFMGMQNNGNIVLLRDFEELYSYDPKSGTLEELRGDGFPWCFRAVSHAGVLVKLKDVIAMETDYTTM